MKTTYPGVYIKEFPSGVFTIAGASTSISVFISRTRKGPIKELFLFLICSDLERNLSSKIGGSYLARAVRFFSQNSGTQSYIVRMAKYAIAAMMARIDASRAVWKAPEGM